MVIFVWATDRVLRHRTGRRTRRSRSTPPASGGCGSSSTSTARARSTSCTCRSAAPVKVTFTSEDVLHTLYFPAFRVKADAIPGRYSSIWFNADQDRRVPPVLRRVLRHQALRHDRQGRRDGAGRLPGVAERRRRRAARWRRAASSCSSSWRASPATSTTAPAAGRRSSSKFGSQETAGERRRPSRSTTRYIRESILTPQAKLVDGYQPLMPTFQGLVNEEGVMSLDRVHEVAAATAAAARQRRRQRRGAPPARRRTGKTHGNHDQLRRRVTYLNHEHTRGVVAPDQGPQAHRHPVPGRRHASRSSSAASSPPAIRLELATPAGDLVSADTYNRLFTMHGVAMVFFVLIPAVPAILGNFVLPLMLGAKDVAFPKLNLLSWYIFVIGFAVHALRDGHRRRRHRLDVLHAVQQPRLEHQRDARPASASSSPASRRSSPA